jgi:hypothetical protein
MSSVEDLRSTYAALRSQAQETARTIDEDLTNDSFRKHCLRIAALQRPPARKLYRRDFGLGDPTPKGGPGLTPEGWVAAASRAVSTWQKKADRVLLERKDRSMLSRLKIEARHKARSWHYTVMGQQEDVAAWGDYIKRQYHPCGYGTHVRTPYENGDGTVTCQARRSDSCD